MGAKCDLYGVALGQINYGANEEDDGGQQNSKQKAPLCNDGRVLRASQLQEVSLI